VGRHLHGLKGSLDPHATNIRCGVVILLGSNTVGRALLNSFWKSLFFTIVQDIPDLFIEIISRILPVETSCR
jgi:hypothetical protein